MHTCAIPVRASSRQPQHCRLSSPAVAGTHFSRQQLELPRLQGSGRHARAPVQAGARARQPPTHRRALARAPRSPGPCISPCRQSPRPRHHTRVMDAAPPAAGRSPGPGSSNRSSRRRLEHWRRAPHPASAHARCSCEHYDGRVDFPQKRALLSCPSKAHERVRVSPSGQVVTRTGAGEGLKGLKSRRDGRRPSRLLWRRSAQQRGSLPGSRGAPMRAGSHADDTVCQHSASARAARGGDGCRSGDGGEGRPALSCAWHSFARAIS